jgi:hypothetical protein
VLDALRTRLTYANVVSTMCLFIVLGSGAYAVSTLGKNSVGTKQIRTNAVKSLEVKDSSLLAQDFKAGELPGSAGTAGPAATARAYGFISSTGAIDAAISKNLTAAKITGQSGAYCVRPSAGSGIDPTTVLPVVTADLASGTGAVHTAQVSSSTYYPAQCPGAAGWEIYTQAQSGIFEFESSDVGFSILVP